MHAPRFVLPWHVSGRGVGAGALLLRLAFIVSAVLPPSAFAIAQVFTTVHSFSARAGNPAGGVTLGEGGKLYGSLAWGGLYGLGSVYVLTPDGQGGYGYEELFSASPSDGVKFLDTPLLAASDGRLYGAATQLPNSGGIYRVDADGNFTLLHTLIPATEGSHPSGLIEVGGAFYGVATQGGPSNIGTLFRMDANGAVTVLHRFTTAEGGYPWASLLAASDGFLYGTTTQYGANFLGSVFRSDLSGNVTVVHAFAPGEGAFPGMLVEGGDSSLYGTTSGGGTSDNGTVFRVDPDGTLTTLHEFTGGDGGAAPGDLFRASDGDFYGATFYGGPLDRGTIFRIDAAGNFETLRGMTASDGTWPSRRVIEAGGKLVGTALRNGPSGVGDAFAFDASGDFEILHAFRAAPEGAAPIGGLVQGTDGYLYGAADVSGDRGYGTIYRLDTAGSLEVVHALDGVVDGAFPSSDLFQGSDGALYGTASQGGSGDAGTVFRCETTGAFTTLHAFTGPDGQRPLDGLAEGTDGKYYGSVYEGGGNASAGTLYRVDSLGNFDLLRELGGKDGGTPLGAPVAASDGNLYGTTAGANGFGGTIYRLDVSGAFEVIHDFAAEAGPEGQGPVGTLIERSDGQLYGVTRSGAVYRSDFSGTTSVVGNFSFNDGYASGGLVDDGNGNLYGVLSENPGFSQGTVYRIDPRGGYTVVHRFAGSDGASPHSRLIRASDGMLYGTASYGGEFLGGVVFRIDPAAVISLSSIEPASGPAAGGTTITIHGSAFLPGASVFFDGMSASEVAVVSSTEITAITPELPAGAAYDVVVINADHLQATLPLAWIADPLDVTASSPFYDAIVRLLADGVSAGCGDGNFCPNAPVTRAQLAVLLIRAKLGADYAPPTVTGYVFGDVPWDAFGANYIEDLAARGITAGCGDGNFCPNAPVTRASLAVLLLKTVFGPDYQPPDANGAAFADVPPGSFAAAWIEDLATRGIAIGCSAEPSLYCPTAATTRGQLAAILVHAFNISGAVVTGSPLR